MDVGAAVGRVQVNSGLRRCGRRGHTGNRGDNYIATVEQHEVSEIGPRAYTS